MKKTVKSTMRAFVPATLLLSACVSQALAQQATQKPGDGSDKEPGKLETVVVTGSRISNPNVVSPQPVSILTAADIKALGATNIGDIMTRMPQLATTYTMGNSGGSKIGTVGLGAQDLRNLGPTRTLVLVNGRRFVSGSTDVVTVDTNMIPVEMIERVEILTGGASAVYGADAVSGVVNFILKDHYDGSNFHLQVNDTQRGDFKKYSAAFTTGGNYADNRGHLVFNIEHSQNDALFFPSVFGDQQYAPILTPGNQYTRVYFPNAGSWGINEGGQFSIGSNRYVFNPDGSVRPQSFRGPMDSTRCSDCDYLHTNAISMLQPKFNRTSVNFNTSFDLSSSTRLFLESSFSWADATNSFQPAFGSGGSANIGRLGGSYAIMPDNAYITPSLAAITNNKTFYLNRFDNDAGGRNEYDQRQTGRVVAGINGTFGNDWQYEVSGNYGVTQINVDYLNNRLLPRFYASIDAVKDPKTGNIVCRSTLDPSYVNPNLRNPYSAYGDLLSGCVPTSVFGDGAINPAARNWFNTTTFRHNKLTEKVASGTLTNNNLYEMPTGAGSVSLVLGAEYRSEEMSVTSDPLDVGGLTFNNAIPGFGGSYNVKEGFGELGVPILSDKPFFKQLGLDMAIRESDYSTAGHTQTWKYGFDWALDENLRLRFTQSFAVRAPNVSELYKGVSQNFFGSIQDPCSASNIKSAPNQGVRLANCAALGVLTNTEYVYPSSIPGQSGSNAGLAPERAKTFTYGFVLTPQFVDGFLFSADYWNIKLADAISSVSAQNIVNNCVDTTGGVKNVYCASMARDPSTHLINFIQTKLLNLVATNTSGVDLAASYSHDLGPGRLTADFNATRTLQYTNYPFQDDPTRAQHFVGTDGFPKWKGALGLSYTLDNWLVSWNARYFSSMTRSVYTNLENYYANPYAYAPSIEGARVYHDAQVSWGDRKNGLQLYFGMHNVFDRKAPILAYGTGFGSALYGDDSYGRSFYAGLNYHF